MPPGDRRSAEPLGLEAIGVSFTYAGAPTTALRDVSVRVVAGEVLLVVGPSGSGKSTLARAIAGLIPGEVPGTWSGELRLLQGERRLEPGEARASVGIVFQDPASQLVMDRVEDDVAFGLENRAWRLPAMRARVPATLDLVGLGAERDRRGSELSGGQQQRLAIAGALAPRPGLLVLDEPTANLDPAGALAVASHLAALRDARAATIVLIEHRTELAWPIADQVLVLDRSGAVIDAGAPAEVLARSRDRLAAAGVWLPDDRPARPELRPPGQTGPASPDAGVAIRLDHVRHAYRREAPAVRDIDLTIGVGERVALVGPNGSGKTTILRLVAGLLRPSHGRVLVGGADPARWRARTLASRVGFVFQDPELGFLADTVRDELTYGLDAGARAAALALASDLGLSLENVGDRSPFRLSGGEQRRLGVATALARRPAALLLDEPTFGLDRRGWEGLVGLLDEFVHAGTTVVAATHDERFVARLMSRRIELFDGWVSADSGGPAGPEGSPAFPWRGREPRA